MSWQNAIIFEDVLAGSTVDALTDILTLDTRMVKQVSIGVKNTGANSCVLRVTSKTKKGGVLSNIEINDVTLTTGSTLRYFSSKYLAEILLSARSSIAGVPTTYSVEYVYEKTH
jgi:hypothetical protein